MSTITLSRYFDANVRLVAGVCSRCYLEADDDVKIVAVNRRFLKRRHNPEHPSEDSAPRDHCQNDNLIKLRPASTKPDDDNRHAPIAETKPKPKVNLAKLAAGNRRSPLWSPPRSPHNLIEEALFRDPWSLLVATIFLNRTSCMCARPRVEGFLRDFAGPLEVLGKSPSDLEKYFVGLGLHRRRAQQVWRMSDDYVHKNWKSPGELYGIGKYGEDAYKIFILGDLDAEPSDRFLRIYRDWARMELVEETSRRRMRLGLDDVDLKRRLGYGD